MEQKYYIVSLKHTSKGDTALTFWCANGCGYTYHRDRAGLYSLDELKGSVSNDNVAVEKEKVDPFWMNAVDFEDRFIAVPNSPTVLHHLGLDNRFMKPKKWKTCKMVFTNTPLANVVQEVQESDTTEAK